MRRISLLAHNVRSLWNVGAFFRTCDAFHVERIYLTGFTGKPPRNEISKTALGAEEAVAWEHHENPLPLVEQLRADGWHIASLELAEGAIPLERFSPPERTLLIVGHELTGVPSEVIHYSDTVLKISMLGKKESLNVAVAAGVALFHIRFCSTGKP